MGSDDSGSESDGELEYHPPLPEGVVERFVSNDEMTNQQIYAKNTDLIVMGSVSATAEVIADGNITIHGSLNGKAMAGAQGNNKARIMCKSFNPDLVAIAGIYKLREDIDIVQPQSVQQGIQVMIKKGKIVIEAF